MNTRNRLLSLLVILAALVAACGGSTATETPADAAADDSSETETTGGSDAADEGTAAATTPSNPLIGAALPQLVDPAADAAIGLEAPGLVAASLTGSTIDIEQADGRGKVYGFFAHWCPHCQRELPRLVSYIEANGLPASVDFYAVSTAVDPSGDNYPPLDWFEAEQWPYEVLDDSAAGAIAAGFGLPGFPYFVVVGGDGTVVQRASGELPDDAAIAALMAIAEGSAS